MSVVVMAVGPVVMGECLHLMPVRMPMFIIHRPVAVVMVAVSMAVSVSMGILAHACDNVGACQVPQRECLPA
jgi:hypothetical protein